ncbi:response regulator [Haloferula chungangensis]|uniref:Response regulator n=1 Tax=Haloferula chungangensis TaxID=1048331 RepID=A0ABW2L2S3_9BACT
MNQITILSLDDEPEVRQAITRDLEPFAKLFRIEVAEDVEDARDVLRSIDDDGDSLGLILCDHRLPGTSGVEFLIQLEAEENHKGIRKVLVTGQADQQDTIRAINTGGLDHYIAKPWQAEELQSIVREQLTGYLLDHDIDPIPYLSILDDPRLFERIAKGPNVD